MSDDYTGMPKPMPRSDLPPRCSTCGLLMWPVEEYGPHLCPPGFQVQPTPPELSDLEGLTDAERVGVAVAAMVDGIVQGREQARALAVRLEGEVAHALAVMREAVESWPETSFAVDSHAKARLVQGIETLEALDSPETPDETEDDH